MFLVVKLSLPKKALGIFLRKHFTMEWPKVRLGTKCLQDINKQTNKHHHHKYDIMRMLPLG